MEAARYLSPEIVGKSPIAVEAKPRRLGIISNIHQRRAIEGDITGQSVRRPLLTYDQEQFLFRRDLQMPAQELLWRPDFLETIIHLPDAERGRFLRTIQSSETVTDFIAGCNQGLVSSIAGRYIDRGLDYDDLAQEGNEGLLKAIDKFDPNRLAQTNDSRGQNEYIKFSSYATWWIRQSVTRAIHNQGKAIRTPVHMGEKIGKYFGVVDEYREENDEAPSDDYIEEVLAERFGYNKGTIADVRDVVNSQIARRPARLDVPVYKDGTTLGDVVNTKGKNVEEVVFDTLQRAEVEAILDKMAPRHRLVIELRTGFRPGGKEHTFQEVGDIIGTSRQRAAQIERQAKQSFSELTAPGHTNL